MSSDSFAARYAAVAPGKPHNALYERPATLALVGDVRGLTVLDAGCGPGICSAILADRGARVLGFDLSAEMVDLARERCLGRNVEFRVGDLTRPLSWLGDAAVDMVLCSLALDYVEDLSPSFCEFRRVIRPGGAIVFSMAHPMRDWMDERSHVGRTYFDTARWGLHWAGFGEPKPYVECYRRPLSAILNPLAESGWRLERLIEPVPLPEMRAAAPELYADLSQSPAFVCCRAVAWKPK